uniref:Beta-1,3-galactosyl-O-glycosyl-glycoprotein beta-1,6-N-acetylglucosaminyltransferase 3 n=1 Tax=Steinernema glaseri TaxID=37863 RepID=A0A1I7Z9R2_9BILA
MTLFVEKLMLVIIALISALLLLVFLIYSNTKTVASTSQTKMVGKRNQEFIEIPVNCTRFEKGLDRLMESISSFRETVNCAGAIDGKNTTIVEAAEKWTFDPKQFAESITKQSDRCQAIKDTFAFIDVPLSREELDYPLAYGLLVHNDAEQIMFLLSSIYQPQNQYCIAISATASAEFQDAMFDLMECFPNIYVMLTKPVGWCQHSVLQGVLQCVNYLTRLKASWKYYQYLSGVDLPLKTNLEMVRIFKKLNGSFNAGIYDLDSHRFREDREAPLPLWKSSLSATFSRQSAEFMVHNPKVKELYEYLKGTHCPDETFWATIAGNPEKLAMPGGFDANLWKQKLTGEWDNLYATNKTVRLTAIAGFELFKPEKYYISRYQIWWGDACYGTFTGGSCVYGIKDLNTLVSRPELVAHKLYFSVQPATYFCLYEHVRRRALQGDGDFDVDAYAELPGPKILSGAPFEEVLFNAPQGWKYY